MEKGSSYNSGQLRTVLDIIGQYCTILLFFIKFVVAIGKNSSPVDESPLSHLLTLTTGHSFPNQVVGVCQG